MQEVGLTPRERQVLELAQRGLTNEAIAQELGVSREAVRYHLKEIHSKLGTGGKRSLIVRMLGGLGLGGFGAAKAAAVVPFAAGGLALAALTAGAYLAYPERGSGGADALGSGTVTAADGVYPNGCPESFTASNGMTLADFAQVFRLPVERLARLNPGLPQEGALPEGAEVNVPYDANTTCAEAQQTPPGAARTPAGGGTPAAAATFPGIAEAIMTPGGDGRTPGGTPAATGRTAATQAAPAVCAPPACHGGVSISVVSAETAPDFTTVVVDIAGRDDLGDVGWYEDSTLVDANGKAHPLLSGMADPGNLRRSLDTFESIPPGAATLQLRSVHLVPKAVAEQFYEDLRTGQPTRGMIELSTGVGGDSSIPVTIVSASAAFREIRPGVNVPFGPGHLVVDRVVLSAQRTTIFGHREGLDDSPTPVLSARPPELVVDGRAAKFLGGRSGYGEGEDGWDFEFGPIDGVSAELKLHLNLTAMAEADRPGVPPDTSDISFAFPLK